MYKKCKVCGRFLNKEGKCKIHDYCVSTFDDFLKLNVKTEHDMKLKFPMAFYLITYFKNIFTKYFNKYTNKYNIKKINSINEFNINKITYGTILKMCEKQSNIKLYVKRCKICGRFLNKNGECKVHKK